MKISIVVLYYSIIKDTVESVASILKQYEHYKIIIVDDNAFTNGIGQFLVQLYVSG